MIHKSLIKRIIYICVYRMFVCVHEYAYTYTRWRYIEKKKLKKVDCIFPKEYYANVKKNIKVNIRNKNVQIILFQVYNIVLYIY